jgi:hypothetical protein
MCKEHGLWKLGMRIKIGTRSVQADNNPSGVKMDTRGHEEESKSTKKSVAVRVMRRVDHE